MLRSIGLSSMRPQSHCCIPRLAGGLLRTAMYLADHEIKALGDEMKIAGSNPDHPFEPERQIQPCSIDLRISDVFWKPRRRRRLWRQLMPWREVTIDLRRSSINALDPIRDWKKFEVKEGQFVTIKPGHTVMGRVYERFRMPTNCAGKIEGRSSFARLGLSVHCTGDFINPGWEGYMPLQLSNVGPYPLRLAPYFSICQLMLILECPRFCGHLNAWVRRTRQEGCGVHATQSSPLPGGVPS